MLFHVCFGGVITVSSAGFVHIRYRHALKLLLWRIIRMMFVVFFFFSRVQLIGLVGVSAGFFGVLFFVFVFPHVRVVLKIFEPPF